MKKMTMLGIPFIINPIVLGRRATVINKNMRPLRKDSWMDGMRFTVLIKEKNGLALVWMEWDGTRKSAPTAITKSNLRSGLGYEFHRTRTHNL